MSRNSQQIYSYPQYPDLSNLTYNNGNPPPEIIAHIMMQIKRNPRDYFGLPKITPKLIEKAMIAVSKDLKHNHMDYISAVEGTWDTWTDDIEPIINELRIMKYKTYSKCKKDLRLLAQYIVGSVPVKKGEPLGYFLKRNKFVQSCLKVTITRKKYSLYRRYSFSTDEAFNKWFKNEVVSKKNNDIVLNFKTPSSWTTSKNIASNQVFNGYGDIHVIVGLETDKKYVFADLTKLNYEQKEVIIKPGKYKCKVIKFPTKLIE